MTTIKPQSSASSSEGTDGFESLSELEFNQALTNAYHTLRGEPLDFDGLADSIIRPDLPAPASETPPAEESHVSAIDLVVDFQSRLLSEPKLSVLGYVKRVRPELDDARHAALASLMQQYLENQKRIDGVDVFGMETPAFGSNFAPPSDFGLPEIPGYTMQRRLGQGGCGEVFAAVDNIKRPVAVKMLLPQFTRQSQTLSQRFVREAELMARVNNPNVIPIYAFGRHDDRAFIVMPLLEGQTLEARLTAGPVELDDGLRMARQMAAGLAAIHDAKAIHRDLKPANIWLTRPNADVVLLDLGIARDTLPMTEGEWNEELTGHDGRHIGTLPYMSPEQVKSETVCPQSDLFSLGTVLYELFSGRQLFRFNNKLDTMKAIVAEPHPPLSEANAALPKALVALIDRLLAKKPEQRPASAHEVIDELDRIRLPEIGRPPVRRSRGWRAAAWTLALGLIALGAVVLALPAVMTDTPRLAIVIQPSQPGAEPIRLTANDPVDRPAFEPDDQIKSVDIHVTRPLFGILWLIDNDGKTWSTYNPENQLYHKLEANQWSPICLPQMDNGMVSQWHLKDACEIEVHLYDHIPDFSFKSGVKLPVDERPSALRQPYWFRDPAGWYGASPFRPLDGLADAKQPPLARVGVVIPIRGVTAKANR